MVQRVCVRKVIEQPYDIAIPCKLLDASATSTAPRPSIRSSGGAQQVSVFEQERVGSDNGFMLPLVYHLPFQVNEIRAGVLMGGQERVSLIGAVVVDEQSYGLILCCTWLPHSKSD